MSISCRPSFPSSIGTSTGRSERAQPGRPTPTFWRVCPEWARRPCAPSSPNCRSSDASIDAKSQASSGLPPPIVTAARCEAARQSPAAAPRSEPPSTWPRLRAAGKAAKQALTPRKPWLLPLDNRDSRSRSRIHSAVACYGVFTVADPDLCRDYFRPAVRNAWNAARASEDLSAALKACISAAI
jgi:hypothetical protein